MAGVISFDSIRPILFVPFYSSKETDTVSIRINSFFLVFDVSCPDFKEARCRSCLISIFFRSSTV